MLLIYMSSAPALIVNNLSLFIRQIMRCQSARNRCPGRVQTPACRLDYIDIAALSCTPSGADHHKLKRPGVVAGPQQAMTGNQRIPGQPTAAWSQYKVLLHDLTVYAKASSSEVAIIREVRLYDV